MNGQAQDLLFESRPWTGPGAVLPHEYRSMATHKTGSLLGCAAALGAVLAYAPASTVEALDLAGRHVGVAFQAVDDLLGIWGDPQVTGKPVHSDLRRLKKTYPVLAALSADHPAARRLEALLTSAGPLDDLTARRAAELIDEAAWAAGRGRRGARTPGRGPRLSGPGAAGGGRAGGSAHADPVPRGPHRLTPGRPPENGGRPQPRVRHDESGRAFGHAPGRDDVRTPPA